MIIWIGAPFMGVLTTGALLSEVYIRATDSWKLLLEKARGSGAFHS